MAINRQGTAPVMDEPDEDQLVEAAQPQTLQAWRDRQLELRKELAEIERELREGPGRKMRAGEYHAWRNTIIADKMLVQADLSEARQHVIRLSEDGRGDEGKAFWKGQAHALLSALESIISEPTASVEVKAVATAAQYAAAQAVLHRNEQ